MLRAFGFDREAVLALADPGRRFEPQLQPLLGIGRDLDRGHGLAAAEDRRFPAICDIGNGHGQGLGRQFEIAQRQIDRRGLAGLHGQAWVFCRQEQAGDVGGLIGRNRAASPQQYEQDSDQPPHHARTLPEAVMVRAAARSAAAGHA